MNFTLRAELNFLKWETHIFKQFSTPLQQNEMHKGENVIESQTEQMLPNIWAYNCIQTILEKHPFKVLKYHESSKINQEYEIEHGKP